MSNTANLQTFDAEIGKFAELLDVAPSVVIRRVVADAHGRITKRTPVDTGRARASWDVKVGSPSDFIPPITVGSVKGKGKTKLGKGLATNALGSGASTGGAAKNIAGALDEIDGTQPVFITTALDYMKYLEDGSSKQAPAGMVALTIVEIEIEIESIIGQLSAEQ